MKKILKISLEAIPAGIKQVPVVSSPVSGRTLSYLGASKAPVNSTFSFLVSSVTHTFLSLSAQCPPKLFNRLC